MLQSSFYIVHVDLYCILNEHNPAISWIPKMYVLAGIYVDLESARIWSKTVLEIKITRYVLLILKVLTSYPPPPSTLTLVNLEIAMVVG